MSGRGKIGPGPYGKGGKGICLKDPVGCTVKLNFTNVEGTFQERIDKSKNASIKLTTVFRNSTYRHFTGFLKNKFASKIGPREQYMNKVNGHLEFELYIWDETNQVYGEIEDDSDLQEGYIVLQECKNKIHFLLLVNEILNDSNSESESQKDIESNEASKDVSNNSSNDWNESNDDNNENEDEYEEDDDMIDFNDSHNSSNNGNESNDGNESNNSNNRDDLNEMSEPNDDSNDSNEHNEENEEIDGYSRDEGEKMSCHDHGCHSRRSRKRKMNETFEDRDVEEIKKPKLEYLKSLIPNDLVHHIEAVDHCEKKFKCTMCGTYYCSIEQIVHHVRSDIDLASKFNIASSLSSNKMGLCVKCNTPVKMEVDNMVNHHSYHLRHEMQLEQMRQQLRTVQHQCNQRVRDTRAQAAPNVFNGIGINTNN